MVTCFDQEKLDELLRLTPEKYLFHRESQELEFKEQYNFAGLADYFRDFAAFGNNRGGYIIFGIKDKPRRELVGLSKSALEQFEKIDPEKISGFLLDLFSSDIRWEMCVHKIGKKSFGIFYIYPAQQKPIIARRDEGRDQILKSGEVYYRYAGRTQKIRFQELENIINQRVKENNKQWLDTLNRVGQAGPENIATFDLDKGTINKDGRVLLVDEKTVADVQWIREGHFDDKGEKALKLVGEVQSTNTIEVVKREKQNLIREYPLSATELAQEVKKRFPESSQSDVWRAIAENRIKENKEYAHPNFRNKAQEDKWLETQEMPSGTPIIYNQAAVDLIEKILRDQAAGDAKIDRLFEEL